MSQTLERQEQAEAQDAKLKRGLGFWSLVAAGVGSVIGSGWLFSGMYAAQAAGPAAYIAWIIAGGLMLCIALVFAELGMVRPESGGLVRYPLYSNGRLTAAIVGWAMWLSYIGNPPSEASAVVQYASAWLPGVYNGEKLTGLGILIAMALMVVFVILNIFGVRTFAKSNNIVTAIKIFLPVVSVILLIASGFDGRNFSSTGGGGGFAPYGWAAGLSAIAGAGLIFTYTGFRNVVELSGEAINPRKHIPRAMITTVLFAIVLYLALQTAYLGAVPNEMLAKAGWHGINFDSPFADLSKLVGLTWLSWVLIADSSISPSGSGIVYTAGNARNVFGLAKNGFFPKWLMEINAKSGVPMRALILNVIIGFTFLLPFPSWHAITKVMSAMAALTFSIGSVTLFTFRNVGLGNAKTRIKGMKVIAPIAFMVSTLVIFWQEWDTLWKTIPIVAVGLIWYVVTVVIGKGQRDPRDLPAGAWLVVYLVFVYGMAAIGTFGGLKLIPGPWDSLIVAVVALALYAWGVRAGTTYMKAHPELLESLKEHEGDTAGPATDEIPGVKV